MRFSSLSEPFFYVKNVYFFSCLFGGRKPVRLRQDADFAGHKSFFLGGAVRLFAVVVNAARYAACKSVLHNPVLLLVGVVAVVAKVGFFSQVWR